MLHACFVRSPYARATIRAIDTTGRARAARRPLRVHRRRPEPRRQGAVAHVDRPGEPGDAAPAARRRRGPLRRRPGRAGRRRRPARSPRTRPSWSRSTTNRCRPSSTTPRPSTPTCSSTRATARTSSARSTACPRRALDDVFAAAAHVDDETIYQQAYAPVPMEGRALRRRLRARRPATSRSTRRRRRRTKCGCSARACSGCPSTASAS